MPIGLPDLRQRLIGIMGLYKAGNYHKSKAFYSFLFGGIMYEIPKNGRLLQ